MFFCWMKFLRRFFEKYFIKWKRKKFETCSNFWPTKDISTLLSMIIISNRHRCHFSHNVKFPTLPDWHVFSLDQLIIFLRNLTEEKFLRFRIDKNATLPREKPRSGWNHQRSPLPRWWWRLCRLPGQFSNIFQLEILVNQKHKGGVRTNSLFMNEASPKWK